MCVCVCLRAGSCGILPPVWVHVPTTTDETLHSSKATRVPFYPFKTTAISLLERRGFRLRNTGKTVGLVLKKKKSARIILFRFHRRAGFVSSTRLRTLETSSAPSSCRKCPASSRPVFSLLSRLPGRRRPSLYRNGSPAKPTLAWSWSRTWRASSRAARSSLPADPWSRSWHCRVSTWWQSCRTRSPGSSSKVAASGTWSKSDLSEVLSSPAEQFTLAN